MDKKRILKETNELVTKGLHKAAIDLIEEYLETQPQDPQVLRALGRIYLLEKQPEQAVKYLQLSLQHENTSGHAGVSNSADSTEDLIEDDIDYIDEISQNEDDIFYEYGSEEQNDEHFEVGTGYKLEGSLETGKTKQPFIKSVTKFLFSKNNSNQKDLIPKDQIKDKEALKPDLINLEVDRKQEILKNDLVEESTIDTDFIDETFDPSFLEETSTSNINRQFDILDDDFEQTDLFESDEDFISEFQEAIVEEEFEADNLEDLPEIDEEFEDKEFGLNDLDEFDELDDNENMVHQASKETVDTTGKIDRWQRARQIAVEVLQKYEWEKENLNLLQQVFFENGWGVARVSIERELSKGLTPEELELAIFVRYFWTENEQYWISFQGIKTNIPNQMTRAVYRHMSWPESLRIIRSFNYSPSEEQIQNLIEQAYDDWYCNAKLRLTFKAFIRYLKYRTGSVRGSLPGNENFSYIDLIDENKFIESDDWLIKRSANLLNLKREGIDLEQYLLNIEQKHMVIKPEGEFGKTRKRTRKRKRSPLSKK